ncbi:unnamed protein product [Malus baccata var. baccata]
MFVTIADAKLEPPIITVNTVLSLLAVDYPTHKLACYVSDDGCSPLTLYSIIEAPKFAKLWDEYEKLCQKIEDAVQNLAPLDFSRDNVDFAHIDSRNHPTIIKVIWETKERISNGLPHMVYVARKKHPNHSHRYKAGAMNTLTRVSSVLTNAPFMLNVDCDMYANNPKIILHAMCLLLGFKHQKGAFVQFPQMFYNILKDDPCGSKVVEAVKEASRPTPKAPQRHLFGFILPLGLCLARRALPDESCPIKTCRTRLARQSPIVKQKPDSSPQPAPTSRGAVCSSARKRPRRKFLTRTPGLAGIQRPVYAGTGCFHRRKVIYGSSLTDNEEENIDQPDNLSCAVDAAYHVAHSEFEHDTLWGKKVGWVYGSVTEDVLTGMKIHARGWKSILCMLGPPAYCLITNSHFLPKGLVEPIDNGTMELTASLFGVITVVFKLLGISEVTFEVTQKEQNSSSSDQKATYDARFTFDESPIFVPTTALLFLHFTALVTAALGLQPPAHGVNGAGLGEMMCSVWLCPIKPDSEAEARQQSSTGANLPRSCALVGQETSPTEIPDANIALARSVGYI